MSRAGECSGSEKDSKMTEKDRSDLKREQLRAALKAAAKSVRAAEQALMRARRVTQADLRVEIKI